MDKLIITKSVGSTQAQNNFGQVLDDVTRNHTCYVVERRGVPQAILIGFEDFARILQNAGKQKAMISLIREMRPKFRIGRVIQVPSPNKSQRDPRRSP